MNFIINNLVVLLVLLAIVGIVNLYLLCRTKPINYKGVVSGRMQCKSPNYSNIPRSIPTKVGRGTMECCGDPWDRHAMSRHKQRKMWPKETCPH